MISLDTTEGRGIFQFPLVGFVLVGQVAFERGLWGDGGLGKAACECCDTKREE